MFYKTPLYIWRYQPKPGATCHTLYVLAQALFAFTRAMRKNPALPTRPRNHFAERMDFYAGKILLLITRLAPNKVGNLFMRPKRAPNTNKSPKPQPQPKADPKPKNPKPESEDGPPPLSAREAAKRLLNFTIQVEVLAVQAGTPIPDEIQDLIAKARKQLACFVLDDVPLKNLAWYVRSLKGIPKARPGQPPYPMPPEDFEVEDPRDPKPGTILHPLLPPIPHPRK